MLTHEYDEALFYLYRAEWAKLLVLMVKTDDDMFSKRIEAFLHAYQYERDLVQVDMRLREMLHYIEHATNQLETPITVFKNAQPAFQM
ncbi:MAG: YhdB family protein [Bacilli bacterium]